MKVDFEDRKYWKTQKCNNLIKPVNLLVESTSDVLCNFVFIFHWDDALSNRSNWVEIIEMMPSRISQIGWKSIEMMPGRIGHHLPHMSGWFNGFPPNLTNSTTQFDRFDQAGIQCHGNGFRPNSLRWCLVELAGCQVIGWLKNIGL